MTLEEVLKCGGEGGAARKCVRSCRSVGAHCSPIARRCAIDSQSQVTSGTLTLSGQSQLARELTAIDPQLRSVLGVADGAILVVDMVIAVARILIDDADDRPWEERLTDLG